MKAFEYADDNISEREIMVAVASIIIGLGILILPRILASHTNAADGLISIALGGGFVVLMTWVMAKLSSAFPGKSLIDYGTIIIGKRLAVGMTFLYGVILSMSLSQIIRVSGDVTKQYLFEKTPIEVISLLLLLVLVYAVGSSRIGLLRLNALFFPFITVIIFVVTGFSLSDIDIGHLQPVLTTDVKAYISGARSSLLTFTGFGIVLFYTAFVKNPKKVPKAATIGAIIPVVLYMMIFIIVVGVFTNIVTANLVYPVVELAKNVTIPGHVFDRFESVFFVIWTMAIFNTAAMTYDIVILCLTSVFKKSKKKHIIFIMTPLVYFMAVAPRNMYTVETYGGVISSVAIIYITAVTVILAITAKIRGMI